jgi:hypothetical protein
MTPFILRGLVATELLLVYLIGGTILGVVLQIFLNLPLGPQAAPPEEVSFVPFLVSGTIQVPVVIIAMMRKSARLLTASLAGPLAVVIACTIFRPALLGFTPTAMEWVERRSLLCLMSGSVLLVKYGLDRMAGRIVFPGQSGIFERTQRIVDQTDQERDQTSRQR